MSDQSKPKISVLLPIYNGGDYLEKTLISIKSQSFKDFEVLCVDDGSNDGSKSILDEFAKSDCRFRVFRTHENLGIVPKVINFVRKHIRGDYFVYSSQDDLFSEDWLDSMYQRALETDADATIPDLVFFSGQNNENDKCLSGVNGNKSKVLTGREAFLYSLDWTIPGNALWKVWLIRKFGYYDFSMNADEYTARVYYLNCSKVAFSDGTFFYRKNNPGAITVKLSKGSFGIPYTDYKLWLLVKESGLFSVDVEARTLKRAIRGLLHYYPFTYSKKFKGSRSKCAAIFNEMSEAGALEWLERKAINGYFIEKLALRSYCVFALCSLGGWCLKRARGLIH